MERLNGKRALHLHFTIPAIQGFAKGFSHAELNVGFHISTTAAVTRTCCAPFRASLVILLSQRKLHGMISGLFPGIIHYSLQAALFPFSAIHTTISCSLQLQVSDSSAPHPYWKKAAGHRFSETGNLTMCKTLLLYSPLSHYYPMQWRQRN